MSDKQSRDLTRKVTHAVLLAAGRGKRLKPHTDTTPKPLLEVNARPTLDYLLEDLCHAGITSATLVTHHLEDQIISYLDSQPWPLKTNTVHQPHPAGTADALLKALSVDNTEPFVLTATDYIVKPGFYKDFVNFHREHASGISVSLKEIPDEELHLRSSVAIDANMYIEKIVEKPVAGTAPSNLSANLLFVLPTNFRHYLESVEVSPRGEMEVQDAINAHLEQHGPAKGIVQEEPGEWQAS